MLEKIKHLIRKSSGGGQSVGNSNSSNGGGNSKKLSSSTSSLNNQEKKNNKKQNKSNKKLSKSTTNIIQESQESIDSIEGIQPFSSGSPTHTNTPVNQYIQNSFNSDFDQENIVENEQEYSVSPLPCNIIDNQSDTSDSIAIDIKIPPPTTTTTTKQSTSFLRTVSSQLLNITKNLKHNNSTTTTTTTTSSANNNEESKEDESQEQEQQNSNYQSEEDCSDYEEEQDQDDEDFDDIYVGLKEIDSDNGKNFNCLSPDQLIEHQHKEIKDIAELLSVPINSAAALLKHFNWKREVLISKYFESPKEISKEVGIEYHTNFNNNNTTTTTTTNSNNSGLKSCTICGDDFADEDVTFNNCQHYFCNDCWAGYLTSKINEGEAMLRCPHHKCGSVIEDLVIQRLVAPFVYDKYLLFSTKKFIQQNQQLRYCPTPGCELAISVRVDSSETSSESVQCSCGYKFCFKCHRESHAPATCDQMSLWEAKCQDESEVSHWKIANCKKCPKCQVSIEKNGGCMHITCAKCTHEWCWMCQRSWKGHNDFYVCNRFQKEKESKRFLFFGKLKKKESTEEEEKKASLQELERYLHYYERFINHENSRKLERVIREEAMRKMEELEKANSTWAEVQFIEKGIDQLLDCRNILKFTYIFAFFSFQNSSQVQRVETAKELFEFLQEDLEKTTEKLSELLEDIMKKSITLEQSQRLEIMNYVNFAKSKKEGLLNAITKDSLFEF
ncbi:ariadne-like ubiquitin ligase [Tieghemostelium lacteum]|uniref:RBR-type E3 ubiquitin transferase n=1 Tax=Tieghemostelium lacteum TaxID=361077 RepID=A0A151Z755_TIELA|nr:ariadne-like ubiquitin ligase [Tieghemostelium lacteum]|eukprot:KYQ89801.1 ariadne-like ubiquitin ligase [Tieghemostelium lacteum]